MPSCENSELFTSNYYHHQFSQVGIVACALQRKEMCHENFSWWVLYYQTVCSSPKSFDYVNTVSSYSCYQYATVSKRIKLWDWKFIVWAETIIWTGNLDNGFITLIPRSLYLNLLTIVHLSLSLHFASILGAISCTHKKATDRQHRCTHKSLY